MGMKPLLAFPLLVLTGCTFATHLPASAVSAREPTDPSAVQIFANAPEGKRPAILGTVSADSASVARASEALRKEAASLGAHAVIHARLTKLVGYTGRTGITGVAVRWLE